MTVIERQECPECGRLRTHLDGVTCRGVMTVAGHESRKWKVVKYVSVDQLTGAVKERDELRDLLRRVVDRSGHVFEEIDALHEARALVASWGQSRETNAPKETP